LFPHRVDCYVLATLEDERVKRERACVGVSICFFGIIGAGFYSLALGALNAEK
jgi:hypothetical protein